MATGLASLVASGTRLWLDSVDPGLVRQARAAGATVRTEPLQGKGNVVRRMFADVEADIYVLVDGDDTYDAVSAPELIRRLRDRCQIAR